MKKEARIELGWLCLDLFELGSCLFGDVWVS